MDPAWLTLSATTVFAPDETQLPRRPESVSGTRDFSAGRPAEEAVPLNGCFAGWDGKAGVRWLREGYGIDIVAEHSLRAVHLFLPADRQVLCIEPVSHVTNVHNHPEWAEFGALQVLEAGSGMRGRMALLPTTRCKPA